MKQLAFAEDSATYFHGQNENVKPLKRHFADYF